MKTITLSFSLLFLLISKHSAAYDLFEIRAWKNKASSVVHAILVVGTSGIYISDAVDPNDKSYVQSATHPYFNPVFNHWVIDVTFFGGQVVQFLADFYYPCAHQHLTSGSK